MTHPTTLPLMTASSGPILLLDTSPCCQVNLLGQHEQAKLEALDNYGTTLLVEFVMCAEGGFCWWCTGAAMLDNAFWCVLW